jgi:hypothetical protein
VPSAKVKATTQKAKDDEISAILPLHRWPDVTPPFWRNARDRQEPETALWRNATDLPECRNGVWRNATGRQEQEIGPRRNATDLPECRNASGEMPTTFRSPLPTISRRSSRSGTSAVNFPPIVASWRPAGRFRADRRVLAARRASFPRSMAFRASRSGFSADRRLPWTKIRLEGAPGLHRFGNRCSPSLPRGVHE